ncbi:MAG: type I methionyl aminopeptidase, partial [Gammaproteobacteria bacterium]|nr:type I methionyl aminopeptidase [Gammaproteobacteria bacterium]
MVLLKSAKEIELIRAASKIVFETIRDLTDYLRPGLTTGQISERAGAMIVEQGGRPAFLGY